MKKLHNYLRTHRKRTGLSQREVAWILELRGRSQVSRHERAVRIPGLRKVLAYAALYRASVKDLFAGLYESIEEPTLRRVWLHAVRLGKCPPSRVREWKLKWIRENCPRPPAQHNKRNGGS